MKVPTALFSFTRSPESSIVESMRFFKKFDHRTKLLLSNGSWFQFEEAGEWGVIATTDGYLINQCNEAIRGERGGVSEITEVEYNTLKKNKPRARLYREVPDSVPMKKLLLDLARSADRVATGNVISPKEFKPGQIGMPAMDTGFRPVSVKRAA